MEKESGYEAEGILETKSRDNRVGEKLKSEFEGLGANLKVVSSYKINVTSFNEKELSSRLIKVKGHEEGANISALICTFFQVPQHVNCVP